MPEWLLDLVPNSGTSWVLLIGAVVALLWGQKVPDWVKKLIPGLPKIGGGDSKKDDHDHAVCCELDCMIHIVELASLAREAGSEELRTKVTELAPEFLALYFEDE